MGQTPWRNATACARAGAAQRVGLFRLRHQPGLGAHRPPLGGRWTGGVELAGWDRSALGAFVSLLAPSAGRVFELTWCRRLACYAVGVVGGHPIRAGEAASYGVGIDPWDVRVGGAVSEDHPGRGGAVLALDSVPNSAGRAAPGNGA